MGKVMDNQKVKFLQLAELERVRVQTGMPYHEFWRVPAMSAGVYVLAAESTDTQSPHRQDEMYYVVRGRARMRAGSEDQLVKAGSLVFVAAEVGHLFYDIQEELTVLVFFAPAEAG
jgi:mannose-6-phosphate isomerase-like protein (cupin superfamily)